jgi:hypothetical protein
MRRTLALALLVAAGYPGAAAAAELRVVVVPGLELSDLRPLSEQGAAVGLLVPDAGPETSAARSLAALERGEVRNSLLGGDPPGDRLVEAEFAQGPPAGRVIVLGLPIGGTQPHDRRYPIAVLGPGYRGLLTSESTRIPGLVSIVDVAPTALDRKGRLGSQAADDPVADLSELDERITANREAKPAVLLVSLALVVAVAVFLPSAALPGLAAVLLANLALGIAGSTEVWIDVLAIVAFVAASLAFVRLPLVAHGLLLAGVLAAYLIAMGIDDRWVALSPLGPTQNARFYGFSNLLATFLLVPALAGATLLGRSFGLWAFGAVAALALVTVGGSQFGADGGGMIVLFAGYGVLIASFYGLTRRTAIAATVAVGVLALALALGAGSHVTDALRDGPAGLAEDFWRRLELSWHRATSGWSVGLIVWGGIVALAFLALRERRTLLTAFVAALAVSLLVNDSPHDVMVAGLAGYLALSSAPGVARPAGERARPAAPGRRAQSAPAASP